MWQKKVPSEFASVMTTYYLLTVSISSLVYFILDLEYSECLVHTRYFFTDARKSSHPANPTSQAAAAAGGSHTQSCHCYSQQTVQSCQLLEQLGGSHPKCRLSKALILAPDPTQLTSIWQAEFRRVITVVTSLDALNSTPPKQTKTLLVSRNVVSNISNSMTGWVELSRIGHSE